MDWPVAAGNAFLLAAAAALVLAPVAGTSGGWRSASPSMRAAVAVLFVFSATILAVCWRNISGGVGAALAGHIALIVSTLTLAEFGHLARRAFDSELAAGLTGLVVVIAITIGPFAVGPLLSDLSLTASTVILAANPLVTIASAAGIDLLHLDVIYRLSPLAHRGVALPAWTAVCGSYAVLGLAGYGASHLRTRSA